jgi:TM2 domain-containing membrane protein YozV
VPPNNQPVAAGAKSRRFALTLNLLLPGAGQFYFGQTVLGSILMLGFVACFVAMLVLFLRAYRQYLEVATSGDILAGDNVEKLSHVFPIGTLLVLLVVSILIYLVSALTLASAKTRQP